MENAEKMSIWNKLISGSNNRKSRLHDELGNRIALSQLLRNGPKAIFSWIIGSTAEVPWISYDGRKVMFKHLTKNSRVLEFGSGRSTMWLCRHAGYVVSVEENEGWYNMISSQIMQNTNVEYHFANTKEEYIAAAGDTQYDLILVDGRWRDTCTDFAMQHLAPGGAIYLDNADKSVNEYDGSIPRARQDILDFAAKHNMPIRQFIDCGPRLIYTFQGVMVGGAVD
ncbi:MAG: hypothetical protein RLY97_1289 [Pseudomonadota bacterium]|jgi:16S rRNA G966 N2-methylase RsmD